MNRQIKRVGIMLLAVMMTMAGCSNTSSPPPTEETKLLYWTAATSGPAWQQLYSLASIADEQSTNI